MSERKERCETCRWWDSEGDGAYYRDETDTSDVPGQCSRFPPQFVAFPQDEDPKELPRCCHSHIFWQQPITQHHDWCGEWQGVGPIAIAPIEGTPFPWSEVAKPWCKKIRRMMKWKYEDSKGGRHEILDVPQTFEEMIGYGRDEVLALKNIGQVAISALDVVMESHGYGKRWKT